jgi:hypothetical protein
MIPVLAFKVVPNQIASSQFRWTLLSSDGLTPFFKESERKSCGCQHRLFFSESDSVSWRVKRSVLPTCTVLAFTNSRMPKRPSSRPCPECLTPSNSDHGFLLDKSNKILGSQAAPVGFYRAEAKLPEPSCVGQIFLTSCPALPLTCFRLLVIASQPLFRGR